jgi:predicted dehydrogenase
MTLNPFAVPVVLFGWGQWSKKSWFPILQSLAHWGVIYLTVVDQWSSSPLELAVFLKEGEISYLPWETYSKSAVARSCRAAFVVTNADAQAPVVSRLLEQVHNLRAIVCEKPFGANLSQAHTMSNACLRAGVVLLVADHYLLRPPVQYLFAFPHLLGSIGEIVSVNATLNESQSTGPDQGVLADLLVHLIDVLLALFPSASLAPSKAYIARAMDNAHSSEETYSLCIVNLLIPDQSPFACTLECGKQLPADQKTLHFIGKKGELHLDLLRNSLTIVVNDESSKEVCLEWSQSWSYTPLILKILSLSTSGMERSVPASYSEVGK